MTRRPSRLTRAWQWWRANFADVARFTGLAAFVYAVLVDKGRNPALIPAATGLIFLKTVLNGGSQK